MLHFPRNAQGLTKVTALVVALVLSAACKTHAETIVSSLNNTSTVVNFSIGGWAGSSFTTDARSWNLTSATVTLELGAQTSSVANVRLFADNAGRPGASLVNLGTRTVATGAQPYTFTAPTSVTLAPSTTYWIAVGNVGTNGGLNVALSQPGQSFTNSGVPGASMAHSISSGSSFGGTSPTNWGGSTAGIALLFAVDGTASGVSTNAPMLRISSTEQGTFVTWPTNFTGFTLEYGTNLPSAVWTPLTNNPTIIGPDWSQQVEPTGGRRFFRLRGL